MDKLPGIFMNIGPDVSLGNYGLKVISVTKTMYKKSGKSFVGLSETLVENDIIQFGQNKPTYRVIRMTEMTDLEGNIHRIVRTDQCSITSFDINRAKVGNKALILNRNTFQEDYDLAYKVYPPYNKHE